MESNMTAVPVELLCLTQRAPLLLHGSFAQSNDDGWVFTSESPIDLDVVDCNAIVNTNDNSPMMTLHITKQEHGNLELHTISKHPREKRSYPRLFSMLNIRLHSTNSTDQIESWMNRTTPLSAIDDEEWITPEPFMNFSVNGIAFTWSTQLPLNSKLLVALKTPEDTHRCVARVVRQSEVDTDAWEVALYFEQMEDAAIDHLVQLTQRLQDSML
jgi:hypothetical protein